jgi:hypothetical protein
MPEVGQSTSHYWIFEKLGSPGINVIYKAEDPPLGLFLYKMAAGLQAFSGGTPPIISDAIVHRNSAEQNESLMRSDSGNLGRQKK